MVFFLRKSVRIGFRKKKKQFVIDGLLPNTLALRTEFGTESEDAIKKENFILS